MNKERISEGQDVSKWKVIYPLYLNSNNTKSGGRLTSLIHSVENPTVAEMAEVCIQLGIPCKLESKRHPRDYRNLGRIRFRLFDDGGKAFNDGIFTKKMLLDQIGRMIPKLKNRQIVAFSIRDNIDPKHNKANNDETQTENNGKMREATHSVASSSASINSNNGKSNLKKKNKKF
ncbi:SRP19 domain-containing protein [Cryptosporidium ubiquitum]|uniref:SRP19 domain-containing protein n=1 Tax=Cryptosporidium ubiquitum TaxID=857276 RepID=A0A1J4MFS8_9CRYT|nr:SRP19 domain-containing protein [Cryptosporidium ubiquitum]OII73080.1 SRP19 domain-containing protein [Cryptosporidium ubiquitum]